MKNMSLQSPQTIWRHQIHVSSSQQAYLFPKKIRFPLPNPPCKEAFYGCYTELSNRKTAIGYGKKSDFTKTLALSPASTKYEHRSLFEKSKSKGKTFGLSREQSPDRSYLIPQIHEFPGPGQYEKQTKKFHRNHSSSMKRHQLPYDLSSIDMQKFVSGKEQETNSGQFKDKKYNSKTKKFLFEESKNQMNQKELTFERCLKKYEKEKRTAFTNSRNRRKNKSEMERRKSPYEIYPLIK